MGDGQGRVCRTEPEAGADVGTGWGGGIVTRTKVASNTGAG